MCNLRKDQWMAAAAVAMITAVLGPQTQPARGSMISVSLVPSASTVDVNQQVDVTIKADIPKDILGFGFDLIFNDKLVALSDINIAAPFVQMPTTGNNSLVGLAWPQQAIGSGITLATVTLSALAPGEAEISIGITPGNPFEGFPEYDGGFSDLNVVTKADISIVAPPANGGGPGGAAAPLYIPEPATVALLGLGTILGRLARARRRA
jgi:hypothetical protein